MIRLPIDQVETGMKAARTLRYDYGGVMLAAGARLTKPILSKLKGLGHTAIFVYDDDTEDIEAYDLIDDAEREKITAKLRDIFDGLRQEAQRSLKPEELLQLSESELVQRLESDRIRACVNNLNLRESLMPVVQSILERLRAERELMSCVGVLQNASDRLFDHALDVSIYSAVLGRHFGMPRTDLEEMTLGAILHDIGFAFLPEDVVRKKSKLTVEEEEMLRHHTTLGYHFLKESRAISLLAAHVAYQHHEHQDGTGFPRGIYGEAKVPTRRESLGQAPGRIHRYALLVAVPNAYTSWIEGRPYRKAVRPDKAYKWILENAGTRFNKQVVEAFTSMVPRYPMGSYVLILDGPRNGYGGVVAKARPTDPARPVIRLLYDAERRRLRKPETLDLATHPTRVKIIVG